LRGDQTLADLHHTIFDAFDRDDEHMYEFQFGKGPMDPHGRRYILPGADEGFAAAERPAAGRVDRTAIASLELKVGDRFGLLVRLRRRLVAPDQCRGHRPGRAEGEVSEGHQEGRQEPAAVRRPGRRRVTAWEGPAWTAPPNPGSPATPCWAG